MTAVGDHVRPFDLPAVDWTVDAVVDMHLDHELIRARDQDGGWHLLSADEAVLIGRHRSTDVQLPALPGDATTRGVLADPLMANPWFDGGVQ